MEFYRKYQLRWNFSTINDLDNESPYYIFVYVIYSV